MDTRESEARTRVEIMGFSHRLSSGAKIEQAICDCADASLATGGSLTVAPSWISVNSSRRLTVSGIAIETHAAWLASPSILRPLLNHLNTENRAP